jgi:hypothetical protein
VRAFFEMGVEERVSLCGVARTWIEERLDVKVAARRLLAEYEASLASAAGAGWQTTAAWPQ